MNSNSWTRVVRPVQFLLLSILWGSLVILENLCLCLSPCVCVCAHVCIWRSGLLCAHTEIKGRLYLSFSAYFYSFLGGRELGILLSDPNSAGVTDPHKTTPSLLHESWDPSLGSHGCVAHAFNHWAISPSPTIWS